MPPYISLKFSDVSRQADDRLLHSHGISVGYKEKQNTEYTEREKGDKTGSFVVGKTRR
jgi:hypothetical protein